MSTAPIDYFSSRQHLADLRTKSVRAVGLTFAFNSSSTFIQTIGVIVMARILSPEEFGLVELVIVFSFLLQTFSSDGFADAVIQKDVIEPKEISAFFWINVAVSVCGALLLVGAAPLIARFYGEPRLTVLAVVLSLGVVATGLGTQHLALLKRNFYFLESSLAEFLATVSSVAIGILLALAGAGYWSLVARRLAEPVIRTSGAWIFCRWRPGVPAFSRETFGLARFGLNVWSNVGLHFLKENFDRIIVGRYYGAAVLGNYGRAFHFSRFLPNQIVQPLSQVVLSTLSKLAGDPARFRRYFARILETMAFVSMLTGSLLTMVGPAVLVWLLGPQWADAGAMFAAFGPGAAVGVLYKAESWLHLSLGRPDRWWRWNIAATVVSAGGYLAALAYGPLGVAAAYSISVHVLLLPALWFAGRPMALSLGYLLQPIWRYWIAAIVSCFAMFSLQDGAVGSFSAPALAQLLLLCVAGTATYLGSVILLHGGLGPLVRVGGVLAALRPRRQTSASNGVVETRPLSTKKESM